MSFCFFYSKNFVYIDMYIVINYFLMLVDFLLFFVIWF